MRPARIAIYTLTRERLEYTQRSFALLKQMAGVEYDHYVVDNGSKDGTREWLMENAEQFKHLTLFSENKGISQGSNSALYAIFAEEEITMRRYDLIIKMDNDCEVATVGLLSKICHLYEALGEEWDKYVLSPRVEGINSQPSRIKELPNEIGQTAIIGGLFHIVPGSVYHRYGSYPLDVPKAKGQDDDFCAWVNKQGMVVGYIENLLVKHMDTTDGQCQKFPEYFKRKWDEEKL